MDGVPPAGSRIRLTVSTQVGDKEFEGTLVPPAGVDLLTLKLANGYNLSHSIADVREVVLIEEGLQGGNRQMSISGKIPPCLRSSSYTPGGP